jgi:hypothetical protein
MKRLSEVSMPWAYRQVGLTHEIDGASAAKVITKRLRERFEIHGTLSQENAKGDPMFSGMQRYGKTCIPWSKKDKYKYIQAVKVGKCMPVKIPYKGGR